MRRNDPSKIYISVGLGYYVEFALQDALTHVDKKTEKLNTAADSLAQESASIKAHIKLVLEVCVSRACEWIYLTFNLRSRSALEVSV